MFAHKRNDLIELIIFPSPRAPAECRHLSVHVFTLLRWLLLPRPPGEMHCWEHRRAGVARYAQTFLCQERAIRVAACDYGRAERSEKTNGDSGAKLKGDKRRSESFGGRHRARQRACNRFVLCAYLRTDFAPTANKRRRSSSRSRQQCQRFRNFIVANEIDRPYGGTASSRAHTPGHEIAYSDYEHSIAMCRNSPRAIRRLPQCDC